MKHLFHTLAMVLALATSLFVGAARAADEFLDPEVAFKLTVQAVDGERLTVRFDIASGYYLYRASLSVRTDPSGASPGVLQIPAGKTKFDPYFGKEVEYFRDEVTLALALPAAPAGPLKLIVRNQGCADKGLCYSPTERAFEIAPPAGGTSVFSVRALTSEADIVAATGAATVSAVVSGAGSSALPKASAPVTEQGRFASALQSRNWLTVAGIFALAGLLLSFTPCVLPMIPILSSIIVGQGGPTSKARGFSLALAYSLGMALVYSALGMAAGLAGEGLAAALQNAWVLGAFALLLVTLSLSMFGAYELQMPSSIQQRLTETSGRLRGGRYVGVFAMGGLSALIVGPCVAAPLAGALVYISQSRDVFLGGLALFSLACGMSVPLLLVGVSAGSLLPRAGAWMERVKHFFGVMLVAVALWMVSPVLPGWALMLAAAALLLAVASYLGAFDRSTGTVTPRRALTQGVGMVFAVLAALQLVGVASGGHDLLRPLGPLSLGGAADRANGAGGSGGTSAQASHLEFEPVADLAALEAAVRASTQPVMLDLYADWCVACKELEALTFTDAAVKDRLAGLRLLRADVTANDAADKALMRRYGLFGPPALLFFKPGQDEFAEARVIGFQDAAAFSAHLDGFGLSGPGNR